jgi:hypothetical protein
VDKFRASKDLRKNLSKENNMEKGDKGDEGRKKTTLTVKK